MRRRTKEWLDAVPNCTNCLNGEPSGRFVTCFDAKAASLYGGRHASKERFICNYYTKRQKTGGKEQ